jgi:hypothetical protein
MAQQRNTENNKSVDSSGNLTKAGRYAAAQLRAAERGLNTAYPLGDGTFIDLAASTRAQLDKIYAEAEAIGDTSTCDTIEAIRQDLTNAYEDSAESELLEFSNGPAKVEFSGRRITGLEEYLDSALPYMPYLEFEPIEGTEVFVTAKEDGKFEFHYIVRDELPDSYDWQGDVTQIYSSDRDSVVIPPNYKNDPEGCNDWAKEFMDEDDLALWEQFAGSDMTIATIEGLGYDTEADFKPTGILSERVEQFGKERVFFLEDHGNGEFRVYDANEVRAEPSTFMWSCGFIYVAEEGQTPLEAKQRAIDEASFYEMTANGDVYCVVTETHDLVNTAHLESGRVTTEMVGGYIGTEHAESGIKDSISWQPNS